LLQQLVYSERLEFQSQNNAKIHDIRYNNGENDTHQLFVISYIVVVDSHSVSLSLVT